MLIDNGPEAIMVFDVEEGRFIDCNEMALGMLGLSRDDLLKRGFAEITHPDRLGGTPSVERIAELARKVEHGGEQAEFAHTFVHSSGREIPCKVRLVRVPLENRFVVRLSMVDVTERNQTEKILRLQAEVLLDSVENLGMEEILERMLKGAIDVSEMECGGIFLASARGDLELMAHRGLSEELVRGALYYSARSKFAGLVRKGEPAYLGRGELAEILGDALVREGVLSVAVIPILFQEEVLASLNVGSKTLESVPAYARRALESIAPHMGSAIHHAMVEKERAEHERRLRSIFKTAPVGIGIVLDRTIVEVNERVEEILGYSSLEMVGKSTRVFYPSQEEYERAGREIYSMMRERGVGTGETKYVTKDGRVIDALVNLMPLDPENPTGEILFTLLDITDRKEAERGLAERLEFEKLLSSLATRFVNIHPDEFDRELMDALKKIASLVDADRCAIVQIGRDGKSLAPTHVYLSSSVAAHQNVYPSGDPGPIVKRWKRGEIVAGTWKEELPEDMEPARDVFIKAGWKCSASIPLRSGDHFLGALGIGSLRREEMWPAEVMESLRIVGNIIASAIARLEAERSLRRAFTEIKELRDQLQSENIYLKAKLEEELEAWEIVGRSRAMREVVAKAERVAKTDSTVLLTGETGTGKGMVARFIHSMSRRAAKTMVEVNCATLQPSLAESELFGHERGAFTGAQSLHRGRFEVANGSTIFLDEVGELSSEMQAKLLRVLQEGEFERLGGTSTMRVDVRVIAASNRDLAREVIRGGFREDLYYRLNVFPIHIPPLRERKEDIPLLVWKYVHEYGEAMGKRIESIPRRTMERIVEYPWPGNVRELRNVIERAVILSDGKNLPVEIPVAGEEAPPLLTLKEMERRFIKETLEKTGWRIRGRGGAAEILGLKPTTLYSRMKKLEITRPNNVDI